ncbi:CAP domain-containing protein [Tenacibaculum sp. IB213877]|uniref:CAP domain-containing protein n=1 Tax=Tenacibaculum sp. IB213877 TaxID=3097351 RepID=UPI002A5AB0B0|nr:CAP domain-containing protein [Tenacibaculum sp. IB213877]MDY0779497.1 CAP domain-containing protein [Tenacibaculum sp. IB213877]
MKKLLILITFFNIQLLFSQMSATEEASLAEMMVKKVNLLRKKKGIHPLKRNAHLAEAAKFHADFMSSNTTATHLQEEELYKTPLKRVQYFTTDFEEVEENIISTRRINPPFVKKRLDFIANMIFNSWKKSPENYKNMISSSFGYTDFGFTYNPSSKQVYATQVLGNKKYKVPNQLSEYAFGIKSDTTNCSNHTHLTANLANYLSIENNEIVFAYNDINHISKIITGANDGFAIDLVTREQLQCNTPNKLDASDIYDGILLKPIYKNELFANNKAENDQKLVVSLGKVPAFLKDQELSANLIVLKENTKCSYSVPTATIAGKRFQLLHIEPKLEVPYIDLRNQGIYIAKEIFFDFETSKTTTDKYTQANFDLDKVHSFDIKSYTSIDGSEKANELIQNKRAAFIKKHIGDVLGFSLDFTKVNIDARANWPLFDYQLELYGYKDKLNLSKAAKRAFANGTLKNTWEKQFAQQRKSKLIAFQHGYWNRNNKQHGFYNLLNGLITDNVHLVNKSLTLLYNKEVNYDLDKDFILDKLLRNKDLVQNVSALFTKHLDAYNIDYVVYFINYWLTRSESLNAEAQKNLLNLYTHTTFKVLQNWNEDSKNAARILHPDNVETLFKVYKAKNTVDALYVNYHMTKIEYFNKLDQKDRIQESFDFVTANYKNNAKTIDDKIALASFFKVWHASDAAKELLLEEYATNSLNEEGTFMLIKILLVNATKNQEVLAKLQEKAIQFNKERWCNWMTKDFQNLRLKSIKKWYCLTCNK